MRDYINSSVVNGILYSKISINLCRDRKELMKIDGLKSCDEIRESTVTAENLLMNIYDISMISTILEAWFLSTTTPEDLVIAKPGKVKKRISKR